MKKLLSVLIVLVLLFVSSVSLSENADPILGAWYIMLDYSEYPQTSDTENKNYMFYIMFFEENGTISGVSGESLKTTGLYASGSAIGTWSNDNGKYTVNMIGVGSYSAEFADDRLLVQMNSNVWYSMQRMNKGDWYKDLIIRFN